MYLEGRRYGLIRSIILALAVGTKVNREKSSVVRDGVSVEIRNCHFPNTRKSEKCYRSNQLVRYDSCLMQQMVIYQYTHYII
jgi:hypothetical protein